MGKKYENSAEVRTALTHRDISGLVAGTARRVSPDPPFILELNKWKVWIVDRGYVERNIARQDVCADNFFNVQSRKSKVRCQAVCGSSVTINMTCSEGGGLVELNPAERDYLRLSLERPQRRGQGEGAIVRGLMLGITYEEPLRLEVYDNMGNFVCPVFAQQTKDATLMCLREGSRDQEESFVPEIGTQDHGANFFEETSGILYVMLRGPLHLSIRAMQVLRIGVLYRPIDMREEEIQGEFVAFLADALNMKRDAIRIVSNCTDSQVARNDSQREIQLELVRELSEREASSSSLGRTYSQLVELLTVQTWPKSLPFTVVEICIYTKGDNGEQVRIGKMTAEESNSTRVPVDEDVTMYKVVLVNMEAAYIVREPVELTAVVVNKENETVTSVGEDHTCTAMLATGPNNGQLLGTASTQVVKGEASFNNITFDRMGMYQIQFTVVSSDGEKVASSTSTPIRAVPRRLRLEHNNVVPYYAVPSEPFTPLFGVRFYDDITNETADIRDISVPWEVEPKFVYPVYSSLHPVMLNEQNTIVPKRYEVLLTGLAVQNSGYHFIINVTLRNIVYGNLSVILPTFNVLRHVGFNEVVVNPERTMVLYTLLEVPPNKYTDTEAVRIHLINCLHELQKEANIINSSASYVGNNKTQIEAMVTMQNNVTAFSKWHNDPLKLQQDIGLRSAFRVKRSIVGENQTAIKQLLEGEDSEKRKKKDGLPDAWIAAIVINVILIVLFILFVIYCYFRSKKRNTAPPETIIKKSESDAEVMYANKSGHHITDTERQVVVAREEAPLGTPVFTVEDESRRIGYPEDTDYVDGYSSQISPGLERPPTIDPPLLDEQLRDTPAVIEGVEDDFEPELRDLDIADSEEEEVEPSEALPPISPDDHPRESRSAKLAEDAFSVASHKTPALSEHSLPTANPDFIPGAVEENHEEKGEQFVKYLVYLMADAQGARDCIGSVILPAGKPMTLSQLRTVLNNSEDPSILEATVQKYNFITETNHEITFQEGGSFVEKVYPAKCITLKLKERSKRGQRSQSSSSSSPLRRSAGEDLTPLITSEGNDNPIPFSRNAMTNGNTAQTKNVAKTRYVGPLGICYRPECDYPGRVKCVDCGMVAYCSTRCLKADTARHRMSCYRPPWRM